MLIQWHFVWTITVHEKTWQNQEERVKFYLDWYSEWVCNNYRSKGQRYGRSSLLPKLFFFFPFFTICFLLPLLFNWLLVSTVEELEVEELGMLEELMVEASVREVLCVYCGDMKEIIMRKKCWSQWKLLALWQQIVHWRRFKGWPRMNLFLRNGVVIF